MVKVEKIRDKYLFEIEYNKNSFKFLIRFGINKQIITFRVMDCKINNKQDVEKYRITHTDLSNTIVKHFTNIDDFLNRYAYSDIESLFIFNDYKKSIVNSMKLLSFNDEAKEFFIENNFKTVGIFEIFKKTLKNCNK